MERSVVQISEFARREMFALSRWLEPDRQVELPRSVYVAELLSVMALLPITIVMAGTVWQVKWEKIPVAVAHKKYIVIFVLWCLSTRENGSRVLLQAGMSKVWFVDGRISTEGPRPD